jgi:nucleoside-diphosphate-sugar epimerase
VLDAPGIEGLALRFGFFYGPGTTYAADGYTAGEVRRRRFPIVGKGTGTFSFIHVDDVVSATIAALDRGSSGSYNVVDDDPAPVAEWLPLIADAVGAKRPRRVPLFIARLMVGGFPAYMMTELRGASNEKAKRELGWEPRWPSWRQGFRGALG